MLCWTNGEFVDSAQVMVSPINHGAFFGVNYTEIFRTYNREAVFLESYYAQLCERLKDYYMMMPYSILEIRDVINKLNAQDNKDGAFAIHVTATNPDVFQFDHSYTEMLVIIVRHPVEPILFYREKEAFWLKTIYNCDSPSVYVRASFERSSKSYEGFFVTKEGVVAAGIRSIIFWVKNDILYTPSLDVGIYPTVPRQLVIRLARVMGYQVQEGVYLNYELEQADECFIVSPLDDIVPIRRLGDVIFAGEAGLLYERLYHAYGHEISQQLRRD
ncbi:MAG: aminotransferase class IV [Solibacillus sp.]